MLPTKTTVKALDDDENNLTADHRTIDYGRRLIKPIALDTPIAISPSKDRITSSPDLIFHVYTPCDTISSGHIDAHHLIVLSTINHRLQLPIDNCLTPYTTTSI
eukprot:jgi/Psemu1/55743/gm1.55743_g